MTYDTLGFVVQNEAAYNNWKESEERKKWIEKVEETGGWKKYLMKGKNVEMNNEEDYYQSLRWMSKQKYILERRRICVDAHHDVEYSLPLCCPFHMNEFQIRSVVSRVLFTYTLRNRSVGYIHGYNTITAAITSVLSEEETFWVVCSLTEMALPAGPGLTGSLRDILTVQHLIDLGDPELIQHLEKCGASILPIASGLVIGLFSGSLPAEICLLIWGVIVADDCPEVQLIRFTCAIIKSIRSDLLECTTASQITETFSLKTKSLYSVDEIVEIAKSISTLSTQHVNDLRASTLLQIERDASKITQRRAEYEITGSGLLNRSTMKGIITWLKKQESNIVSQHDFLSAMSSVNISAAENSLHGLYQHWESSGDDESESNNSLTAMDVIFGLILLMDGALLDKMKCLIAFCSDNETEKGEERNEKLRLSITDYKKYISSKICKSEVKLIANKVNASLTDIPVLSLSDYGNMYDDACSVFHQLDTSGSSSLTAEQLLQAVFSTPALCIIISGAPPTAASSPLWSPDDNQPHWIPDTDALFCYLCKKHFRWFRRRHHCRSCGQVACNSCTSQRKPIVVMGFKTPVRMCTACCQQMLHHP